MTQAEANAANIAAQIVVDTIQYMADKVGISFEATVAAIMEGGNAQRDYYIYLAAAENYIRTH